MKTKIQIKTVFEKIIFEHESENNTIIKTVNEYIIQELKKGLRFADLRFANLRFANLRSADLSNADLRFANLRFANLSSADLSNADLSNANLRSANLSSADLSNANLSNANLSNANLSNANLRYLNHNECTGFLLPQCPSEGSFIAWKKAGEKIVKLLVTDDAKRSSGTTLKCRCSKAKVLGIENLDGTDSGLTEIKSNHDDNFIYRVGEIVEVDNFDKDRFNECSTGIHFFIARESAVAYW